MKEYRSKEGGRYLFNEDMRNLQELALSVTEMFKDCGENFVISGCKISVERNGVGDNVHFDVEITGGYVFIDDKIRKVQAIQQTVGSIQDITIYGTTPEAPVIMYSNGTTDRQYDDYSATALVNYDGEESVGRIVAEENNGEYTFPNLRTVFFSHYCLVNDGWKGQYAERPTFSGGALFGNNEKTVVDGLSVVTKDLVSNVVKADVLASLKEQDSYISVDQLLLFFLKLKNEHNIYIPAISEDGQEMNINLDNLLLGLDDNKVIASGWMISEWSAINTELNQSSGSPLKIYVTKFNIYIRGCVHFDYFGLGQAYSGTVTTELRVPESLRQIMRLTNNVYYSKYTAPYNLMNITTGPKNENADGDNLSLYVTIDHEGYVVFERVANIRTGQYVADGTQLFLVGEDFHMNFSVTFDRIPDEVRKTSDL